MRKAVIGVSYYKELINSELIACWKIAGNWIWAGDKIHYLHPLS